MHPDAASVHHPRNAPHPQLTMVAKARATDTNEVDIDSSRISSDTS